MARQLIASHNFSKKDIINSKNGIPLQDFEGDSTELRNITKAAMIEDVDPETGETKYITVLVIGDDYYTSISGTIYDSMGDVLDVMADEEKVDMRINRRKSKGGRDFLTLNIL